MRLVAHADYPVMDVGRPLTLPFPERAGRRYASSHDCRVNCGLRSADRRGRRSRSRGVQRLGRAADRRPLPGRKLAGDYAQFADLPGLRQRHRRCVRPRIPGFSPGGLGPHLTSSGSPRGLSSGFPFARRVLPLRPPSSGGFPSSGVLRFVPFGRCPVPVPLRCPSGSLPLSNLHHSAAAARFRRRWSRAARAKVTSPAAILQGPACPVPGPPGSRQRPGGGPAVPGRPVPRGPSGKSRRVHNLSLMPAVTGPALSARASPPWPRSSPTCAARSAPSTNGSTRPGSAPT